MNAVAKGLSKTYVAVSAEDETSIPGYYTITTTQLDPGALLDHVANSLNCSEIGGVAIIVDALKETGIQRNQ